MFEKLQHIFLRGLFTFLPIAITIYIVYVVVSLIDHLFGNIVRQILPAESHIPGLGFLITIFIIFVFGLMLNNFLAQSLLSNLEKRLLKVPFIKAIYSPLRDLMNLFSKKNDPLMKSVVLFQMIPGGPQFMGLLMREDFKDIPGMENQGRDRVAIYLPMSYGFGGFTVLAPRSLIQPVDIPIERAMSLAITAWVKGNDDKSREERS
jgi:uncharacterized membrane protein